MSRIAADHPADPTQQTTKLVRFPPLLLAVVLVVQALHAGPPEEASRRRFLLPQDDSVFQVGEELTYNVSYASVDIGQVRIKIAERVASADSAYYVAYAYIDSYKGIPFVNLHTVYQNHIGDPCHSDWFFSRTKENDEWTTDTYSFDYGHKKVFLDKGIWKHEGRTDRDSLAIDTVYQDGLSLFFFAREHLLSGLQLKVPTLVNRKRGYTDIDFKGERTNETIEAVEYPIDLVHFTGEAKFVGVFGLTGGFEGWFSNDAARVPVLAKMKVLVGNVRIELMKWKRAGWQPPRSDGGKDR